MVAAASATSNGTGSATQALAAQALGDLGQRARIAAVEQHVRTLLGQRLGHREARARARRRSPGRCARRGGTDRPCFPYRPGSGNKPAGWIRGGQVTKVQRERVTIKAAGRLLAVQRLHPAAAAAGPTLVFLHEGLGSIALWKDFRRGYARGWACRASSTTAGATGSRSRSTGRARRPTCTTRRACSCRRCCTRPASSAASWSATATAAASPSYTRPRSRRPRPRSSPRRRTCLSRPSRWPASAPRASPMPRRTCPAASPGITATRPTASSRRGTMAGARPSSRAGTSRPSCRTSPAPP